jgi:hypothetical protein
MVKASTVGAPLMFPVPTMMIQLLSTKTQERILILKRAGRAR